MDGAPRTIDWVERNGRGAVELIDQRRLPEELVVRRIDDVDELVDAIVTLAVRGAPAIGVAGAFGVVLAGSDDHAVERVRTARPTAVNLAAMVDRVAARRGDGADAVLAEALAVRDGEIAASWAMGRRGAALALELTGERPIRIMTICNTGALAAVERGTALAVAFELADQGRLGSVTALETRPLLQGARLTCWELAQAGIAHRLVVDSAAAGLLARGDVDLVLTGADRIACNGDVANKVGTLGLALAAADASVPFVVVAPETSVDESTPSGDAIEIEERSGREVTDLAPAPPGTSVANPAFDVTPRRLIRAIVTDHRVW